MDKATGIILIGSLIGVLLGIIIFIPILLFKNEEDEFCEVSRKIRPGMFKNEVIYLLGDNYTISYYKNGVEKLEWRYYHNGYAGRVANGFYVHSESFTRRIRVTIQKERVVEVKSLNLD